MRNLEQIGATEAIYCAFREYETQGLTLARVAVAQRELYTILTEAGPLAAEASGGLYYRAAGRSEMPVTGDWVAARVMEGGPALVEVVLPRRGCLSRRAAGTRGEEQALAAHVDVVFLVCGLDGDFNLRRIERYLALVQESGAEAIVVLNKADLCEDLAGRIAEVRRVARQAEVIAASGWSEDGVREIERFLRPGGTVALLGSSGVGKSTLANRLLGEERLRTQAVRADDSRGRHTTVRRELMALPGGGALIDTPGLRELQLWASTESVEAVFDEIAEAAEGFLFRDCTHTGEPGCAVRAAVERGEVEEGRWGSFQKLRAEAAWHESQEDVLAGLERKRKWKIIHKEAKRIAGRKT